MNKEHLTEDARRARELYDKGCRMEGSERDYHQAAAEGAFDELELSAMKGIAMALDVLRGQLLDVGTGSGALIKYLLPELIQSGAGVDAVDVSEAGLAEVRAIPECVDGVWAGSFYDLPFERYDTILANFSLNYAEDIGRAFRSVADALKMGGYLIFSTLITENPDRKHPIVSGVLGDVETGVQVYAYKRTEAELVESLQASGLEPLKLRGDGFAKIFQPEYYHPRKSSESEEIFTAVFVCQKLKKETHD